MPAIDPITSLNLVNNLKTNTVEEVVSPKNVEPLLRKEGLHVTPFQQFLDQAVEALQGISNIEFKANDLSQQYIEGTASVEDAVFSTSKLNMAMSLATSVVNSSIQTFKEIQQIQV